MTRIPFEVMKNEIQRILLSKGFDEERAEECAKLFSEASLDGVYSHGLNRVPRFVNYIDNGWVDIHAKPTLVSSLGILEQYDGNLGPGNLNAKYSMDRAISLAHENGVGIVTVKNSSHWMRGGSYGWQAANAGCIGLCWTNTESCMPPWGAKDRKVGNNPMILAVPRPNGPIVLDMAMSQFSYGKLEVTRLNNEILPVDGGFDSEGNLTRVPEKIEKSMRILPAGYWKGSGLAIMLDLIAALLSGGLSTSKLDAIKPAPHVSGYGVSQVFIAFNPIKLSSESFLNETVNELVSYLHESETAEGYSTVSYPGERTLQTRKDNFEKGIPVDDDIWNIVLSL
ncbi:MULTISPECIES: 3-dehydro-L-gulonate 2-dehydrogenase [unclassified Halomonas]|uniref:3-dehydro-L-gulonate 2-dehydrogenase n=1 Tax=unclassified Halomonas TaxID=2609666 RepID=UPI0007D9F4BD|nr:MULTISPECIES: 3-dehydro-L-gulonate 2-dehydrogenase [unclassified Halomonas]MBT2787372.1 3-dehydro-L-gulonate 2-dehydrogenase [Halomonas sp. ISL-106]MBT2796266.1 3-dehydro-L-gulonate 2-dehydrogenase [Halomonas sp. ISL-104]OAL57583.1 2,3-diketo-L-gulonate reductase [Halomonas sp. ALS9]